LRAIRLRASMDGNPLSREHGTSRMEVDQTVSG
jgi:hypothetical protein